LVMCELRYYREVISSALSRFRPNIEVITREPELSGEGLIRLKPDLVICTSAIPPIRAHCFAWVEMYPRGEPVAVACIDGHSSTINEPELDDFVTIIDQVANEKAVRVGGGGGGLLLGDT
jgi:hypothetical protein